jgi:hypothetical protein
MEAQGSSKILVYFYQGRVLFETSYLCFPCIQQAPSLQGTTLRAAVITICTPLTSHKNSVLCDVNLIRWRTTKTNGITPTINLKQIGITQSSAINRQQAGAIGDPRSSRAIRLTSEPSGKTPQSKPCLWTLPRNITGADSCRDFTQSLRDIITFLLAIHTVTVRLTLVTNYKQRIAAQRSKLFLR